jgi:hypothetical protein
VSRFLLTPECQLEVVAQLVLGVRAAALQVAQDLELAFGVAGRSRWTGAVIVPEIERAVLGAGGKLLGTTDL